MPPKSHKKGFILIRLLVSLMLLMTSSASLACDPFCCPYDSPFYPKWFGLIYIGKMTNDNLGQVLTFNYSFDQDTLYSLEIGKELHPCNIFRRFLQPVVTSVDVRANVTVLDDTNGTIYEVNPYFALNWRNRIGCRFLRVTASFGEGISYVSRVPFAEARNSDQQKQLLNFLLFELAFALPQQPRLELVARIHHRSGVFGLYHATNDGSTAIGLALRYYF